MPYVQVEQFPIDKATNTIVEEGIAPIFIREYHRRRGRKVLKVEKNLGDLQQSRLYDLVDGYGVKWEVKADRMWHVTGNVYIELQALEASQADKYLIFAGYAFIIGKSELYEAIKGLVVKAGGDELRSLGALLPVEVLEEVCEEIIIL
jgi:hypothetical protein